VRIGIVSDIHEAIEPLQRALAEFRRRDVDQVVSLGDACDTVSSVGRSSEVIALLRDAAAVGVWGNHDFGLCFDVPEPIRRRAAPEVLSYMATMRPHLTVDGCRFSHIEPWRNAHQLEDLWYHDDAPDTPERAARSFAAVTERCLFVGHFHQWLVMTPAGKVDWAGEAPLTFRPNLRYLVVLAPVVCGWCAVFDTTLSLLTPIRLLDHHYLGTIDPPRRRPLTGIAAAPFLTSLR
jgi:predicted phosphodiesterase